MRLFLAGTLLLAVVSWSVAQKRTGSEDELSSELEDFGMTLDSLIEGVNELSSTFGAELLQELHLRAVDCKMNVSRLEYHYQGRIRTLMKYFHSLEEMVSMPNFDRINNEKRRDIESNFHRAMRETEREQRLKLESTQALCEAAQEKWLGEKLTSSIAFAKQMVTQNPAQYRELLIQVSWFQAKMAAHMERCRIRNRRTVSPLNCAIDELEKLITFSGAFISSMKDTELPVYAEEHEGVDTRHQSLGSRNTGGEELENDLLHEFVVSLGKVENAPSASDVYEQVPVPRVSLEPVIGSLNEYNPSTGSQSPPAFHETTPIHIQGVRSTPREMVLSTEISNSGEEVASSDTNLQAAVAGRSKVSIGGQPSSTISIGEEAEISHLGILLLCAVLGVVSLAVTVVLIVLVTRMVWRGYKMRSPSENAMLDMMKKTGYVNPTYKLYSHC